MRLVQVSLLFLFAFAASQKCDFESFSLTKDEVPVFQVSPIGDIFGCQDFRDICQELDTGIQTLELDGGSISLTNGNSILLPDYSIENEIQSLSIEGQLLSLSSSNQVTIPLQS